MCVFFLYSPVSLSSCTFLDILHCLLRAVGVPLESALNLVSRMSPCGAHDTHLLCSELRSLALFVAIDLHANWATKLTTNHKRIKLDIEIQEKIPLSPGASARHSQSARAHTDSSPKTTFSHIFFGFRRSTFSQSPGQFRSRLNPNDNKSELCRLNPNVAKKRQKQIFGR